METLSAFLIRLLFVVGMTLLPVVAVNQWFIRDVCRGDWAEIEQQQGTRYAVILITGCLALGLMLAVAGAVGR